MFSSGVVDALISLHCQSVKRYLNQNHHYMKWIVWLYMYIMMSLEVTFLQCFPLAKEHLHSMGIPQWPIPGSTDPFPVFSYKPPRTVSKRLAGNVTWLWTRWNHIKRLRSGWFFAIVTVIATVNDCPVSWGSGWIRIHETFSRNCIIVELMKYDHRGSVRVYFLCVV